MNTGNRLWWMRYDADHYRLQVMIENDFWSQVKQSENWYDLDLRFRNLHRMMVPPHGWHSFGYQRALRAHPPTPSIPTMFVSCQIPSRAMQLTSTRLTRVANRLMSLRSLFELLRIHGEVQQAEQSFEFDGPIRPVHLNGFWTMNGQIRRDTMLEFHEALPMWTTVQQMMWSAFLRAGGAKANLGSVGMQYHDRQLELRCGQTVLKTRNDFVHDEEEAKSCPFEVVARHPGDMFVILAGLATIDNLMVRTKSRRAA